MVFFNVCRLCWIVCLILSVSMLSADTVLITVPDIEYGRPVGRPAAPVADRFLFDDPTGPALFQRETELDRVQEMDHRAEAYGYFAYEFDLGLSETKSTPSLLKALSGTIDFALSDLIDPPNQLIGSTAASQTAAKQTIKIQDDFSEFSYFDSQRNRLIPDSASGLAFFPEIEEQTALTCSPNSLENQHRSLPALVILVFFLLLTSLILILYRHRSRKDKHNQPLR